VSINLLLRTNPTDRITRADHLLDAFADHDNAATVWSIWRPVATRPTTPAANDLLWLSIAVLAADALVLRSEAADGWTRDIGLKLKVGRPEWAAQLPGVDRMLRFLTGDEWSVRLGQGRPRVLNVPAVEADAVCLLSGGLDSLVGAINLLGSDDTSRVLLVGVEDSSYSAGRQAKLSVALSAAFPGRVAFRQTWTRFRQPTADQERPIPMRREQTTRSRSLLFLGSGLTAAAAIGPMVPLHVPENGLIGINVPLVPARSGTLSTRTTHPHFLDLLRGIAIAVGVQNPIVNNLRLQTKGEALTACARPDLLAALAPTSVSCAHPTATRYLGPGRTGRSGCGYCYPCLIRRASMHVAGLDDGAHYAFDVLTRPDFVNSPSTRADSLRATLAAIRRGAAATDVLRTGPVREFAQYANLHRRGLAEIEAWMRTATDPDVRARLR